VDWYLDGRRPVCLSMSEKLIRHVDIRRRVFRVPDEPTISFLHRLVGAEPQKYTTSYQMRAGHRVTNTQIVVHIVFTLPGFPMQ